MSFHLVTVVVLLSVPGIIWFFIQHNDQKLSAVPPEAARSSPVRETIQSIRERESQLQHVGPHPALEQLPPATGRRYIVVGGAGFLGGHIVLQLLARGESAHRIRVLDINLPLRDDLQTGAALAVDFRQVDVTDRLALLAAFTAVWPDDVDLATPTTVFHTASTIRFYERHPALLSRSERVNVGGTQNVLDAARAVGADVLLYTSSGSITVRRTRFLLWPWEKRPAHFVQALDDKDALLSEDPGLLWSNYAVSKQKAEQLVRRADETRSGESILRTGCIRPSNGVYGLGGDTLAGAFLVRKLNPTWIPNIVHNFVAVENCALAHLLYEQRLIELAEGSTNPNIGGQSFTICDPGPPPTYGDVYLTLTTLTNGACYFPLFSPTTMLLLSHALECIYLTRERLISARSPLLRRIAQVVPRLGSDIVNLQPALFGLTMVHLVFNDARARLPPGRGGLGYVGALTTMEGMCRLVDGHVRGLGNGGMRSMNGGFGLGFLKVQRSLGGIWMGLTGAGAKVA